MKRASTYGGAALTALAIAASAGRADPFQTGSLVIVRIGDGSGALSGSATAVFLEERSPVDGGLLQTVPLPVAASGASGACTSSGTATSEGFITLSDNGQYLIYGGYNATPGTASIASTSPASTPRVAARIDLTGVIDTTTQLTDASGNIRCATSDNGINFWTTSNSAGTRYATLGSNGPSTQVCSSPANMRVVNVFGGQLYGSSASGAFVNVFTIGTGAPTTSGQTASSLPGMPTSGTHSNYDFFLADANTLYVSDDGIAANGGGIQKWVQSGGTWTNPYNYLLGTSAARGVTGKVASGVATLWATASGGTSAWTITDTLSATIAGPGATQLAGLTIPANEVMRGLRVLPGTFGGIADGACCLADGSCSVVVQTACEAQGGFYHGDHTTCGSVSCTGSCCLSDNTCRNVTAAQCTTLGGTFNGLGTACSNSTCGARSGACCLANHTCSSMTQAACAAQGGIYRGDGTLCAGTCNPSFTPGNLVVLQAGDGSTLSSDTAALLFLTEVRLSDGAVVQSYGLPVAQTDTGNRAVTLDGLGTTEGQLGRSADGRFLVLSAYSAGAGTTAVSGSSAPRVVARISASGFVDSTTAFTDGTFSGSTPRGAASSNGTDLWLTGNAAAAPNAGVRYAVFGDSTSLQVESATTNVRSVGVFGGQLYMSTGSAVGNTGVGVYSVGTGLPTTADQPITQLSSNTEPLGFFLADANTLYTGGRPAGVGVTQGAAKYTFDGSEWLLNYVLTGAGNLTAPLAYVTGTTQNGITTLYGTVGLGDSTNNVAVPGNSLVSITDNGSDESSPLVTMATAPANTVWKSVAIAPGAIVACYANCDGSTQAPILNVQDFTCFLQKFAGGDSYANCDGSTQQPILNVQDFTCFLQKFAAGCP